MATEKDPAMEADERQQTAEGAGPEAENAQGGADELLLSLQDAQAKADEYWNQLLRVRAEMANVQRRAERELENAQKDGLENSPPNCCRSSTVSKWGWAPQGTELIRSSCTRAWS